ncbi:unnamed protein product [Chondrus crispus]|uniref:Secreted protein n=1 Tax=Chondrus crispus TaxID=2769 RepID=R7QJB4_CHOCR|nr:unnamed protein product [Chondrus crispus]CDF38607.1 unnamed protein product [Chondrus crispus]|eukprot:XP_005718512.1 unnamed protein product [Chondrus crispus]
MNIKQTISNSHSLLSIHLFLFSALDIARVPTQTWRVLDGWFVALCKMTKRGCNSTRAAVSCVCDTAQHTLSPQSCWPYGTIVPHV